MEKQQDALSHETAFEYDSTGSLTRKIDSLGRVTSYEKDKLGRTIASVEPSGSITRYEYNAMNQLQRVVNADGNATDYTYNATGLKLSETDPQGNITSYSYDALGRLTDVTDALGAITTYRYDGTDNVIEKSRRDSSGSSAQITTYTYDANGNRLSMTNPIGEITSYAYNELDSLVQLTDADGYVTRYSYDEMGRQIEVDYNGKFSEKFEYNTKGQLIESINQNGKSSFTYDLAGHLRTSTDTEGRKMLFSWTPSGLIQSIAYPSGEIVHYEYDAADQLTKVIGPKNSETEYSYNVNGRMKEKQTAEGIKAVYRYTALNQLESLSEYLPNGELIRSVGYRYDASGNMIAQDELNRGMERNRQYKYDQLNQLIEIKDQGKSRSYSYDDFGNRVILAEAGALPVYYEYNNANELLKKTQGNQSTKYNYDKRGNMIEEKNNDAITAVYTYDEANRLSKMEADGETTRYFYNVDGHRTKKIKGTEVIDYVLDPLDPYGNVMETYKNGAKADTLFYGNDRIGVLNGQGDFYQYGLDHLGSTVELRKNDGGKVESYQYDEFGDWLTPPSETAATEIQLAYTGHEYDRESGLHYAKARYLNTNLGRFVSEDTYEGNPAHPQSLNYYTYVENNPINYADPSGEIPIGLACLIPPVSVACAATAAAIVEGGLFILGAVGALALNDVMTAAPKEVPQTKPKTVEKPKLEVIPGGKSNTNKTEEKKTTPVPPPAPKPDQEKNKNDKKRVVLFHYTDGNGYTGILQSGVIWSTLKNNRPRDARLGQGQYFTDIAPFTMSLPDLSYELYRNRSQVNQLKFYLAIDLTGLKLRNGAPQRPHIYAHVSDYDLNVRQRIVTHGSQF